MFENGIKEYVVGECKIEVNFPVGFDGKRHIACRFCPYLSSNERMCQINKEPVAFPDKFVGGRCPLREKKENEVKENV